MIKSLILKQKCKKSGIIEKSYLEEKERVEKEGRQDDQNEEDMEVNDEEQNIEENIAVAEVDFSLGWDLNYEPPIDNQNLLLFTSPKELCNARKSLLQQTG